MDRRTFIGGVAGGLLAAPIAAVAQQAGKVPRIGMLLRGAAPPPGQPSPLLDAFRAGLRDLGYVEPGATGRKHHRAEPSPYPKI